MEIEERQGLVRFTAKDNREKQILLKLFKKQGVLFTHYMNRRKHFGIAVNLPEGT